MFHVIVTQLFHYFHCQLKITFDNQSNLIEAKKMITNDYFNDNDDDNQ